jgi:hypothetical protein
MHSEELVAIAALEARISLLTEKVQMLEVKLARNKSSALVRVMTDDDARLVLGEEFADLNHLDTAQRIGLTYGQVYSARKGFTFKHVARELKLAGVKSKWIVERA